MPYHLPRVSLSHQAACCFNWKWRAGYFGPSLQPHTTAPPRCFAGGARRLEPAAHAAAMLMSPFLHLLHCAGGAGRLEPAAHAARRHPQRAAVRPHVLRGTRAALPPAGKLAGHLARFPVLLRTMGCCVHRVTARAAALPAHSCCRPPGASTSYTGSEHLPPWLVHSCIVNLWLLCSAVPCSGQLELLSRSQHFPAGIHPGWGGRARRTGQRVLAHRSTGDEWGVLLVR